jgi:hypothetical protein
MTLQAQIKWVTNIADFKKAIEEGTSGIVAHTATVDRLTRSLSGQGLLAAVNNYVAAVDKMGGAHLLTADKMEKVNALTTKAIEQYEALGKTAPEAVLALHAATTRLQTSVEPLRDAFGNMVPAAEKISGVTKTFGELTEHVKATALGFISAQAIIGGIEKTFHAMTEFVGESVQEYLKAEAGAKRLTVALERQGQATPGVIADYKELGETFQRTTVNSSGLITDMEALLTQVGNVAPSQMQKALQASADLASGLGIDLQSATMLVAKAFAGGGDELGRLKAILGEAYRPGMDMAQVLDAIQSKFGGQAQAEAETYSGKIKQLTNDWDNFKESVGRAIVEDPALQALLGHLRDGVRGSGEAAEAYTPTITDYWAAWTTGSRPLQIVVGWLNVVEQAFKSLDQQIGQMKPVTPKQFMPEGDFFADLDRRSKQFSADLQETWKKDAEAADRLASAINASFRRWSGAEAAEQMHILDVNFRRMADSGHITEAQVRAMAAEAARLGREGATLSPRLWDIVMATGALNPKVVEGADAFASLGEKAHIAIPELSDLNKGLGHVTLGIEDLIGHIPKMDLGFQFGEFTKHVKQGRDAVDDLGRSFAQMASMANGSLASILGGIADLIGSLHDAIKLTQQAFSAGEGGGGSNGAGASIAKIAMMATGWGAVALAAYKAGKAIYTAMTDGRKAVTDFAATFANAGLDNGFDNLHARLIALGAAGEALWIKLTQGVGRGDQNAAKKVIEEINAALAAQDGWMSRLPGLIEKYGLSWEQAGQQAKQAHLDEIARGLIQDFADLTKAGFDVTLVTEKMGDAINDYVHMAMRTGTEIPSAMRPLLEKMIEMGSLTDLNGDKITDLEDSGITFATTLTEGFRSIVDAIHDLTRALGAVPTRLDIDTYYHQHGAPPPHDESPDPDPTGAQTHHSGTARVVPFPIIAHNGLLPDEVPAILQTGEAVLNRRAAAAVGTQAIGALNRGDRPRGGVSIQKGAIVVNGAQNPERVADEIMRKLRREMQLNVA